MANLSEMTREEQVLYVLKTNAGRWVDGTLLANEKVGGSEGLKRLRELKQHGHLIQKRKHPDPHRSIYQYRLVEQTAVVGPPVSWVPKEAPVGHPSHTVDPVSDRAPQPVAPNQMGAFMDNAPVQPEKGWHEWKPSKKSMAILECVYWTRNPKRRVVGSVGIALGGGWFWGLLVPGYRGHGIETAPEERYGGVAADKEAARAAVEKKWLELRGMG